MSMHIFVENSIVAEIEAEQSLKLNDIRQPRSTSLWLILLDPVLNLPTENG